MPSTAASEPDAPEDGLAMRVPGGVTGDPVVLLVLGRRRSGDLYSSEDRDLLGALVRIAWRGTRECTSVRKIAKLSRELEPQKKRRILRVTDRLEDEIDSCEQGSEHVQPRSPRRDAQPVKQRGDRRVDFVSRQARNRDPDSTVEWPVRPLCGPCPQTVTRHVIRRQAARFRDSVP